MIRKAETNDKGEEVDSFSELWWFNWLVFLDLNAITLIIQYLGLCSRTVLWQIDPCPDAIARGEIQEHVLVRK